MRRPGTQVSTNLKLARDALEMAVNAACRQEWDIERVNALIGLRRATAKALKLSIQAEDLANNA